MDPRGKSESTRAGDAEQSVDTEGPLSRFTSTWTKRLT
jgi:hypothetical protein